MWKQPPSFDLGLAGVIAFLQKRNYQAQGRYRGGNVERSNGRAKWTSGDF
jgi:hypothetical protein